MNVTPDVLSYILCMCYDENWMRKFIYGGKSPFYNIVLTCKAFKNAVYANGMGLLLEMAYQQQPPRSNRHPLTKFPIYTYIDVFEDMKTVMNSSPRSYYDVVKGHKSFRDVYVIQAKWGTVVCTNGYQRSMVHRLAEHFGYSHRTYMICSTYSDHKVHEMEDGYSSQTDCEGCKRCLRRRCEKAGVLIVSENIRNLKYATPSKLITLLKRFKIETQQQYIDKIKWQFDYIPKYVFIH